MGTVFFSSGKMGFGSLEVVITDKNNEKWEWDWDLE